ncbi:DUF4864 domain-containing protein [Citreimonas salinaria]|uniref:DUF4864 domain-containing protein n=1 Tax=Citreimonas salinaria TaxID=321339 RepID=A0A1H3MBH0_9RHOB|nr:DUF4864 domain-containing protein [Citreimonas salinaria]SDY74041.1 protein of unknown function [Citreimonas salinaria]
MRQTLLGLVAALALVGAVRAQDVLPPEPGIEATIQSQIDAFLRDDLETAFGYSAPSIQGMFQTPDNFGAMVRNGYPMVWRPEDLRFGDLVDLPGGVAQTVIVTDAAGVEHWLEYRMTRTGEGWLIAGVRIVEAPGLSA